jgi:ribonuclease E
MSDIDVPAGQPGGPSTVSEPVELPEKLRVHALARRLSVTSRRVLDALIELGAPARGPQSSIDRTSAARVAESLGVELAGADFAESSAGADQATSAAPVSGSFAGPFSAPDRAPEPAEGRGAEPSEEQVPPGASMPLFAAPSPMFLPPEPVAARPAKAKQASKPALKPEPEPEVADSEEDRADGVDQDGTELDAEDGDDGGEGRRRRRRGRRGRGRGRGSDDDGPGDESSDEAPQADDADSESGSDDADDAEDDGEDGDDEGTDNESGGSRRRRRRRRRRGSGDDSSDSGEVQDPPNTVTRVREPRSKSDGGDSGDNSGIQGVRGSTRLEAKRQRRRDGRDAGRRRTPVLSESEFLARRESVERTMVVRQHGERSEVGVLEDGVLVEHFVTSSGGTSLVGNVYLGRVQNVLPSMEAAFIDIGRGRNAVLYAGEVDWDLAGLAGKARKIEQALSSGDSILVQVTKDPVGHKGARLTTQISLPGRFVVYVPAGGTHGISRKLADTERRRLKDLLKEIVPDEAGVIIRTASEGVSQEALERDVRRLQVQWEVVDAKAQAAKSGKSKAPELLYEEPDLMIKVVRDQFNEDFSKLVVSGDDAWDTLTAYVSHVAPELQERIHRHVGTSDVFSEYRIDEQLMKALDRKVWLPSGGTLVIDRTEAMTVVDVNTGKFTGSGGNLEETVTRNNLEAAEEIVRQLRLRDIGGIIVIDFIDMVLESNRDLVLRRLTECLGRDRTRHQVAEVTSLGLVQMTRKRVGVGLLEAFSTPCEHCRGRGVMVSADPVEVKPDFGSGSGGGGGGRRRGGRGDDGGARRRGANSGDRSDPSNGRDISNGTNGRPVTGQVATSPEPSGSEAAASAMRSLAERTGTQTGAIGAKPAAEPATAEPVTAEPVTAEPVTAEPVTAEPVTAELATAEPETVEPVVTASPAWSPTGSDQGVSSDDAGTDQADTPDGADPDGADPDGADPVGAGVGVSGSGIPGIGGAESSRPARRRRRVASRPAGPPVGEDPV